MADEIDRAQERDENFRAESLDRLKAAMHEVDEMSSSPFCEDCEAEIGIGRLLAQPKARRCIACQEAAERRGYLGKVAG
ncbi:RNA polymerase-binding transcription factor DksA [Asticcacaulis sp. MM231]|uniref:TraR/DksA family transcriptional regulator n=1 Tax=Asticcacaulis sp. MM231 TaxID=3157666 RepID=UPI0032D594FA